MSSSAGCVLTHHLPGLQCGASRRTLQLLAFLGLAYVVSYLVLSTAGINSENPAGVEGYFFVDPVTDDDLLLHFALCKIFSPLIALDRLLNIRPLPITNMPLMDLSRMDRVLQGAS